MDTTPQATPYVRVKYSYNQSILERFWYIFIIILFIVAFLIMFILWCAVRAHFREKVQKVRCNEIEENNGSLKRGLDLGYDKPNKKSNSALKKKEKRRVVVSAAPSREEQQGDDQSGEYNAEGVLQRQANKDYSNDAEMEEEMMAVGAMDEVTYVNDLTPGGGGTNSNYNYEAANNNNNYNNSGEGMSVTFQDPYSQPQMPYPQESGYAQPYAQQQQYVQQPVNTTYGYGYAQPQMADPGYGYAQPQMADPAYGYAQPQMVDPAYGYAQQQQQPQQMMQAQQQQQQAQQQAQQQENMRRHVSFKLQGNGYDY